MAGLQDALVAAASAGHVPNAPASPEPERIPAAVDALRRLGISYLRLERMDLGDVGVAALAAELSRGTAAYKLRVLYLGDNRIGDSGADAIADALRQPGAACRLRQCASGTRTRRRVCSPVRTWMTKDPFRVSFPTGSSSTTTAKSRGPRTIG